MKIKLAKTVGYCLGVRRAIDSAFSLLARCSGPVYSHGDLIHNVPALKLLAQRGLKPWEGQSRGAVLIRAHGLPPEEVSHLKQLGLELSDATCPRVRAVQTLVAAQAQAGRTVLIWGKADHPEVVGLAAYAPGRARVLASVSEIEALELPPQTPVALVSQTTQDIALWPAIAEAVRKRWPAAVIRNTICQATETRQADLRRLCREVEALLVIGGRNSGNTARLVDIGRQAGLPTYLVETAEEIEPQWLKGLFCLGVAAGASTGTWQIAQALENLRALARDRNDLGDFLPRLLRAVVLSSLYSALGLAALAVCASALLGQPWLWLRLSFFFFLANALQLWRDFLQGRSRGQSFSFNDPERAAFFAKYGLVLKIYGLSCTLLAAWGAFLGGSSPFWAALVAASAGALIYFFLLKRPPAFGLRRTLGGPALVAAGWTIMICLVAGPWPLGAELWPELLLTAGAVFGHLFVLAVMGDVVAAQGDRIFGRPTLPTVCGLKRTRRLLEIFILMWALVLAAGAGTGLLPPLAWLLILSGPVYNAALLKPLFRSQVVYGCRFEALIFGQLLLGGLMAYLCGFIL